MIAGERFGRLTFVAETPRRSPRHYMRYGRFVCDCGREIETILSDVRRGASKSCGCVRGGSRPKHGMAHSPEYSSWRAMLARCLNPKSISFKNYGGRGVTVYEVWQTSFAAFYAHVGPRPPGTTLDRIDTNGNYEPGNVRWATPKEQAATRRAR
jgi:hypothetical protein